MITLPKLSVTFVNEIGSLYCPLLLIALYAPAISTGVNPLVNEPSAIADVFSSFSEVFSAALI